jgi:hypothetical protein
VPAAAIGFNWKRATPTAARVAIASGLVAASVVVSRCRFYASFRRVGL